jgi:hypothetical protein
MNGKLIIALLLIPLIETPALANHGKEKKKLARDSSAVSEPSKAPTASAKKVELTSESANAAEIEQLREMLQQQSRRIQEQQDKLNALAEELHALRKVSASAAALAQVDAGSPLLSPPVAMPSGYQPSTGDLTQAANSVSAEEGPATIRVKGISITPGGFLAAETIWRQRALNADVNTPFNSTPYPGSSQSKLSEFNGSGRQTRLSLLAEGRIKSVKFTGYYETDWLSAGTTSNNNQSNSYTNRQRQLWAEAGFDSGWTFTGGQMWSLVTERKKGTSNRSEAPPTVIDSQFTIGFSWARQFGFRIAKNFNDKVWLAFAVEGPQMTFGGHNVSNNFLIGAPGSSPGLYNDGANYNFNLTPDFIFKAAFEPGWGHYELFGVISTFRSRIFPCAAASAGAPCAADASTSPSSAGAFNDSRVTGGAGANARVPLFNGKLDAGLHFFGGDGVGRYGTGGLPDVTARPDGALAPISGGQGLGTLEWHALRSLDIYFYGGGEYTLRRSFVATSTSGGVTTDIGAGYGSPLFNNAGCSAERLPGGQFTPGAASSCTGDTRSLIETTVGFWHRLYSGTRGTLQWGPQYSYLVRNSWSATGGQPKATNNMLFTSFRYVLP